MSKARSDGEYDLWLKEAMLRGWKTPENAVHPAHSWVAYWEACADHEANPSSGRPVVPHRSA